MNRLNFQWSLRCLLVLGGCLFATLATAAPELRVFGVDEDLEQQIKLFVGAPSHDTDRATQRFIESLPDLTKRALAAVGYYGAEVKSNRSQSRDGDFIDLRVTLNDPTLINIINLSIKGDARKDAAFMRNLGGLPIRKNNLFVSADYEAAKSRLIDAAQDLGYFDFDFTESSVRVSRRNLSADITLVADSGERYTFGPLRYDQTVFTEAFLKRWTPFEEGDPYESGKIAEAVRDLQASGYFKSVRVLPQRDPRYGKTVPVTIELEKKDNNLVGIGIGYATDTKIRTKLTWSRPLLNRLGHSVELQLELSKDTQNASVSYKIPRRKQPLTNYFSIDYGLRNSVEGEAKSFLSTLSFQRVRRLSSDWQEALFLKWERERYTVGNEDPDTTDLWLPGVTWSRSRSKGRPFLTWGQSSSITLLYGSRKAFSTVDLYKSVLNFKYIRAVSERNTFITAAQYGAISSNDFERVPLSQRFFAGGDRSIRGFRYLDISPRDLDNVAVGGRYLEVLSFEHNYRFRDRWSSAIFVDGGRAFNNFDEPYSVGAGVGIRWQSPVGPFRLDIAVPVSENVDSRKVRVHLSLGPDL